MDKQLQYPFGTSSITVLLEPGTYTMLRQPVCSCMAQINKSVDMISGNNSPTSTASTKWLRRKKCLLSNGGPFLERHVRRSIMVIGRNWLNPARVLGYHLQKKHQQFLLFQYLCYNVNHPPKKNRKVEVDLKISECF